MDESDRDHIAAKKLGYNIPIIKFHLDRSAILNTGSANSAHK
jgi:hypothetical protein